MGWFGVGFPCCGAILLALLILSNNFSSVVTVYDGTNWAECNAIIDGDYSHEALTALHPRRSVTITRTRNCSQIKRALEDNSWLSEEEQHYPIAYAIAAYQSSYQLLNLLSLIYRPNNLYCVHLDRKMPHYMEARFRRVLQCFPSNVFEITDQERVNVTWGHYSVLEAFMLCAKALFFNKQVEWAMLVNVNEKELPLRTNWELVRALRALNRSSLVYGMPDEIDYRIPEIQLPFEIKWIKSTFLVALQRNFVEYMLTDDLVLSILEVMKAEDAQEKIPDETLFGTLIYNTHLGAPGACDQIAIRNDSDPRTWLLSRFIIWDGKSCTTKHMRNDVCILGRGELPTLMRIPHLFANKFLPCVQPEAYHCLYYWIKRKMEWERIRGFTDPSFDPSLYGELYCSKNHL